MSHEWSTAFESRRLEATLTKEVRLRYLLAMPAEEEAEAAENGRWPLVLFLHGAGERGDDLELVTKHGPPRLVCEGRRFPFFLVAPQCPGGEVWSADALLTLLDEVLKRHPIDPGRVYLTGLSMGGYGTWSLGLKHPERFAAIVPICGGGNTIDLLLAKEKQAEALCSLGIWAFHGAKDPVVPVEESRRMVEALRRFGCREVELTVYPEAEHDSWTQTYANDDLYEWLLMHRRG
ncbi:MAG: phospholipase [Verrucomicrobia bacterium]|nr:MAG: phospholipase [Verrucomicrobiota bacterium]